MRWGKKRRESSDPYYDLIDDFDLIISSFQSQYGIRLSRELKTMKWGEFRDLLVGISPDTALGRIVAIRSEDRKEILKQFSPSENRIRNEWRAKRLEKIAKTAPSDEMKADLNWLKNCILRMAGCEVKEN